LEIRVIDCIFTVFYPNFIYMIVQDEEKNLNILSEIVIFNKYAKYLPKLQRRETWKEIVFRYLNMMENKYPQLKEDIWKYGELIADKKILPSMRALQFAGRAIEKNNARLYNCSYLPIDDYRAFSEAMFLLLSGCGVGYSVQNIHISKLPSISKPIGDYKYLIADNIEGWADAIRHLIGSYLGYRKTKPRFDFSDIRPKGERLVTSGGKAPGPEPLKRCLFEIEQILDKKNNGDELSSLEVHSIMCHLANAVLAGGIRRSAMISLFDADNEEMLACKSGNWWETNPHFGRANNSAVLARHKMDKKSFLEIWKKVEHSGSGEPGLFLTNNVEYGTNPCVIGDTEVLTKNGYKEIQSLINQKIDIWNGFEWSTVTPKITGYNQHVIKVTLSDGRELTSTDYHKWYLAEGYTNKSKEVTTKDLKIGDKIIKYNFPIIKEGKQVNSKHAYTQGFISAEGMDDYKHFWLYEPKYICKDRLDIRIEGPEFENINGTKRKCIYYNDIYNEKSYVPFDWCLTSKIEWLAGLFDGDGTELVEGGLQLCSTNLTFLKDLQKLLSTLGVNSKIVSGNQEGLRLMPDGKGGEKEYFCNTSYRICIGAVQMQELKTLGLACERLSFNKSPQRDASQFVKIVKIEDAGYVDAVYCFNEPKRHYGVFNGILTGQCAEIALKANGFCNLTTINASNIESEKDLLIRVEAATFFGTLQAGFTDFHYLRSIWKKRAESEALLGVSMTGIASGDIFKYNIEKASLHAKMCNEMFSKIININKAARICTIKPEGTASLVIGTSSGIHDWHDKFYIRRMQIIKSDNLYKYLIKVIPELIKDYEAIPNTAVLEIPIKAPSDALLRNQTTAISLLERVKLFHEKWIKPSHNKGDNTHNVSATISIKEHEWNKVGEWMWNNRNSYTGLSVLPYDGGTYYQAPFETINEEKYNEMIKYLRPIDLTQVLEIDDNTTLAEELACAGGSCEIK
jgi:hypothetical protein